MQITPAIHALRHNFQIPVGPGVAIDRFVWSFLVFGETITLIDTGVAGCEKTIFDYICSTGRDTEEVSLVVLTHSHPDHIGAAGAIRKATGCSIMAHPGEKEWIEDVGRQNRERPVPGFSTLVGGNVKVDYELADGDVIDIDGSRNYELQVIHTPGHSVGSISLLLESERALFSGDAVPVEGDLPVYDDVLQSYRSVQRLRCIRGLHHILPAWDDPREGSEIYEQMDRALTCLQRIHDAVLKVSEGTDDPMEIAKKTAALIGLPPQAVTPMLARTFQANIRAKDLRDLSSLS